MLFVLLINLRGKIKHLLLIMVLQAKSIIQLGHSKTKPLLICSSRRSSSKVICQPLGHILNQCFDEGLFPSQFKYAEVKRGKRKDPENYRPLSILISFSTIFEKVAYNQIVNFLNLIFSNSQYGFRSARILCYSRSHCCSVQ